MNDERAMILTMLREGKISVDEADALLDVLNDDAGAAASHAAPSDAQASGSAGTAPVADDDRASGGRAAAGDDRATRDAAAGDDSVAGGASASGDDDGPTRDDRTAGGRSAADDDRATGDGGRRGSTDFRFDFDPSSLSEGIRAVLGSVKETMSGVSESLKHAFSEFGDLDIHFDLDREMGRRRAEEQRRLSLSADGYDRLHVSTAWGDIRVSGADTDRVEVVADVASWAATDEEAAARLRELVVELVPRDGVLVLELAPGTRRTRTDCQIVVPRRFGVSVSSGSGDIWLEDVEGSQSVQTASGDISVASVGGDRSAHHLLSLDRIGDHVRQRTIIADRAGKHERGLGFHERVHEPGREHALSDGLGYRTAPPVGIDRSKMMLMTAHREHAVCE